MEVIVRMTKVNPWTGLIKWSNCFDFISSYWTRSGSRYTGLKADKARELEQKMGKAEGELQYLFLLGHKRVANGIDKVTPSTDYVLINKEAEAEQINKANKVKRDAYRALDKMSLEDMRKCLRLFGVKADTMSNELVEARLGERVDNPNKEINFVIEEALSKNIIRKNRASYYFGTDLIGNGLEDVIAYLKDKKNQDIYLSIMSEIKSK